MHDRLAANTFDDERVLLSSPASIGSAAHYEVGGGSQASRRRHSSEEGSEHSLDSGPYYRREKSGSKDLARGSSNSAGRNKRKADESSNGDALGDNRDALGDIRDSRLDPHMDKTHLNDLFALQEKIARLKDPILLQKIVDEIETSATYELTDSTFDFDLMKLSRATVIRLKCLVK